MPVRAIRVWERGAKQGLRERRVGSLGTGSRLFNAGILFLGQIDLVLG